MDFKQKGILDVKFLQGKLLNPERYSNDSEFYLRISLGTQHYSTSSKPQQNRELKWEDSMRIINTEEALNIECFCEDRNRNPIKIGSTLIPIQGVIAVGLFKGNLLLMSSGKVSLNLKVEMKFEKKPEIPEGYATYFYAEVPPELPHVHAYNAPPNFTYTPPEYYQTIHGDHPLFN